MSNGNGTRRGFTFGEVLATVAILAVIAAIVVPTIHAQLQKADPQRVGRDAVAVRAAVEQFLTDVRRYPRSVGQLTHPITGTGTDLVDGVAYTAQQIQRWKGPYLQKDSVAAIVTGWGHSFQPALGIDSLPLSGVVGATGNPRYVVLFLPMDQLDSARARVIDQMFDDGDFNTGLWRWKAHDHVSNGGGATDTMKFLIVPVQ